jgi:hypothetical protein
MVGISELKWSTENNNKPNRYNIKDFDGKITNETININIDGVEFNCILQPPSKNVETKENIFSDFLMNDNQKVEHAFLIDY